MKDVVLIGKKIPIVILVLLFLLFCGVICARAEEETVPDEYSDFIGSLDPNVTDKLPDGAFSDKADDISGAAQQLTSPLGLLSIITDLLGEGIRGVLPTLVAILGAVILSAVCYAFSAGLSGGLSRAVGISVRLCTFCIISGTAVASVERLQEYFDRLFMAVASFIPLSATLYAMGGNVNVAAGSTAAIGTTLTVCQFICTHTVIPVFCICLCLSVLSVLENSGGYVGTTVGGAVRKWYTTAFAIVMAILGTAISSQTLLASRADNAAMRGMKLVASSFIPLSGGTVSTTLGTLVAGVEVLRGSVGVIGIGVILMTVIPTVIELALLRGVFAIGAFCAGILSCHSEQRLLGELDGLYGYLEGVAVLSVTVFLIAMGMLAGMSTPFS